MSGEISMLNTMLGVNPGLTAAVADPQGAPGEGESIFKLLLSLSLGKTGLGKENAAMVGASRMIKDEEVQSKDDTLGRILWDLQGLQAMGDSGKADVVTNMAETIGTLNTKPETQIASILTTVENTGPVKEAEFAQGTPSNPDNNLGRESGQVQGQVQSQVLSKDQFQIKNQDHGLSPEQKADQKPQLENLKSHQVATIGPTTEAKAVLNPVGEETKAIPAALKPATASAEPEAGLRSMNIEGHGGKAEKNMAGEEGRKMVELKELPLQAETSQVASKEIHQGSMRPIEQPQAYSQLGKEINAKLEQKGPMEFTMELEPKDLGKIDVKLKLSEGRLIIDIMAANAKTQTLLAGQVDKLIASIGLQNVKVENVQILQQNDLQDSQRQNQGFLMDRGSDMYRDSGGNQFSQQWKNQQTFSSPVFQGNKGASVGTEISEGSAQSGIYIGRGGIARMDYTI